MDKLEELLATNADKKLWHLGSMPPLMIAMHDKWKSLKEIVKDGKGANCAALLPLSQGSMMVHPFKDICAELFERDYNRTGESDALFIC